MNKIYITGCAKSGTTIVRRLFNAFQGVNVCNEKEITLDEFIASDYTVGKRTFETIFSADIPEEEIQRHLRLIKENNIRIIYVVRKKEDVLKSDGGYVKESRWTACMKQSLRFAESIDMIINYDVLISEPLMVQYSCEAIFGLESKHKWSDYPDFINIEEEDVLHREGLYKLRKLGEPA